VAAMRVGPRSAAILRGRHSQVNTLPGYNALRGYCYTSPAGWR
jgi:hypothetical protein